MIDATQGAMVEKEICTADIKEDISAIKQQISEQKARYKELYQTVRYDNVNKSVELVKAE